MRELENSRRGVRQRRPGRRRRGSQGLCLRLRGREGDGTHSRRHHFQREQELDQGRSQDHKGRLGGLRHRGRVQEVGRARRQVEDFEGEQRLWHLPHVPQRLGGALDGDGQAAGEGRQAQEQGPPPGPDLAAPHDEGDHHPLQSADGRPEHEEERRGREPARADQRLLRWSRRQGRAPLRDHRRPPQSQRPGKPGRRQGLRVQQSVRQFRAHLHEHREHPHDEKVRRGPVGRLLQQVPRRIELAQGFG
mmetsp:Transcript_24817/g.46677  ORF Transcript_24817/g.46677 Transcript_24817/m.46677 type:complete len:248 (+) Transcript_24817:967-1710(+)